MSYVAYSIQTGFKAFAVDKISPREFFQIPPLWFIQFN